MPDPDIYNFRRIDARTTSSGQPTEAQLGEIAALGVTHIINLGLHSHEKALPDEAGSVAALGMEYTHIPVAFDAPSDQDFSDFCTAMAAIGDMPVHVHCIVNMRVSAFFYRYRRDVLGLDEAAARVAMDSLWQPGGVWAAFIGDAASVALPHRAALT
ncbi:MAG: protein tyrosine phosphatase family protein [Sandarakinorhabdus sp.]|nr:protein tyrosine phosphatase family protein [Sandarakinorhabdus sp.]